MKKNITFILILLTISCNFIKESRKKSDNLSLSENCNQLHSYDAINFLKKQIYDNRNSDSTRLLLYIKLANYYSNINEKKRFKECLDTINKIAPLYNISKKTKVEFLKIKGLEQIEKGKYNDGISYFHEAASLLDRSDTLLLYINYKIAVCYERLNKYDSSEYYCLKACKYKNLLKNIYTDEVSMLYNALAYYKAKKSDLYTAKSYYDSVEYVSKKNINPDSSNLAWNLFNMGIFYQQIGNNRKEEACFSEALKIYSKYTTFSDKIATINVYEAYTYTTLEKFEQAHSKTDWSINYYTKNFNPISLLNLYCGKGYIFFRERKNKEAIQYFKKALDFDKRYSMNNEVSILNSIAWCYSNENMLDSAEYYFRQCRKLEPFKDMNEMVPFYGEFSKLLIKKKKYQDAINIIDGKSNLVKNKLGIDNTQYGYFIYWKALAYEKLENYPLSLNLYHQIINISINKSNKDPYILPDFKISEIKEHDNLIDALIGKASVLAKMSKLTSNKNEKISYLEKSLEHYEKAYEVVIAVNKQMESENDRLMFTGKKASITEKILIDAFELFKLTEKPEFLEKAFFVADMGKATQVVLGLKNDEYKRLSGIPENLIRKEKDLQEEISLIQSSLRDEKFKKRVDTSKSTELNNKLYNAINSYEKLVQKMNSDYPQYDRIKYSANNLKIDSLKKLISPDKVLISYTITGDSLFSFLLSGKLLKVNVVYYKNLNDSIINFRKLITEINDVSFTYQGIKNYVPRAYYLYKVLLKPFEKEIEGKNLILIPDGLLNILPFEALITSDSLPVRTDYAILSYLVNKHAVSYSYSAELFALRNKMKTIPTNEVLAYAPEYDNTIIEVPSSNKEGSENIQLGQLKGSQEEVTQIALTFGGKAIEGKKATKSHFKNNANKSCIVHLAMHTIIDNENPLYSKLVFTPYSDNHEKAFLNTYEIYNLKMQAPLVVLSACNTGYGKIMKGEGIISLARGFIFSGCPSLVITLWSIADRSSSNLMQAFYKNLKRNNDVDISLQNAKIDYITNSDQRLSHPYFWAGYIQTGKVTPVYEKEIDYKLIITIGIILFIVGFAFIIRKYF